MKTRNQYIIKTISLATVVICLQFNFLFGANATERHPVSSMTECKNCDNTALILLLSPYTPSEAIFEDGSFSSEINFAPVTPAEASFEEDADYSGTISAEQIAPVTPVEATFEDSAAAVNDVFSVYLAPITPAVADFNE